MKSMWMYLAGYVILVVGLVAALWKLGILARLGPVWTLIGIVVAIGLGVMLAVSAGGAKTIEVDDKH